MVNNDTNGTEKKLGLKKSQILRGFDAYRRVLSNSRIYSTDLLLAYLNTEDLSKEEGFTEETSREPGNESPLIDKLKVGFIISKRKVRKAVMRNYGKRLLKEAFRLNQGEIASLTVYGSINIIFSFSENGLKKLLEKQISFEDLKDELRILLAKTLKSASGGFRPGK